MDLIISFKQRKERYPEEYAPEIVAAATQYEMEEGAEEWMAKQEAEAKADPDIVAVRRVRIPFKDAFRLEVRKALLDQTEHPVATPPGKPEPS